ncbi:MAG TPA: hypothetical protein VMG61_08930 [Usitatibacter sp.]|nr:hypothetical protein [Usitatibacter sp.]
MKRTPRAAAALSIAVATTAYAASVAPPSELPAGTKRWTPDRTVMDVVAKAPNDLQGTIGELKKLAAAGNPQAMAVLANYRYTGYGIWKDESAACQDSMKAFKEGAPNAMLVVAPCLWDGKGTGPKQAQAETAYHMLSEAWETYRYRDALTLMGQAQSMGMGTAQDLRAAERTFRMAAQYGDGRATYLLAKLYDHGQAGEHSREEILWLYREAALLGDTTAQVEIARRLRNSPQTRQEAYAWTIKASEDGDVNALRLQAEIAAKMKEAGAIPDKAVLKRINEESYQASVAPSIKLP